ncbi:hypothetical protein RCO27_15045 [Sphingosinicella sp. LHD-64]|uniref:hypothetical protein n=1 Tax=Sphingosinicella sp. LHD-64 TaxID=3072139 RepID=UPI00280D7E92|nr:hypothetical protein [Sphingosinicella sp. LHD-64]MDQ8757544.1 hypothetical protein [Sphingosinicella sp. LHD-64]
MSDGDPKPIVLITGAAGNIGRPLAGALTDAYRVVRLDQPERVRPRLRRQVVRVRARTGRFPRRPPAAIDSGVTASPVEIGGYAARLQALDESADALHCVLG